MATPREIRRLAFQLVFQMDAQNGADEAALRAWMVQADLGASYAPVESEKALATALAAHAARSKADAEFDKLAPTWPARRQAAVDRAILRLCHFEMATGAAPPKAIVNDGIELAKEFSTDKSPAFINGLLDKVLKRLASEATTPPSTEPPATQA